MKIKFSKTNRRATTYYKDYTQIRVEAVTYTTQAPVYSKRN